MTASLPEGVSPTEKSVGSSVCVPQIRSVAMSVPVLV